MNQIIASLTKRVMSQRDDDILPEKLRHDLHDLVPSLPGGWDQRNVDLLGNAHRQVGRASGWVRAAKRLSAAAALLLAAGIIWQVSRPEPQPVRTLVENRPTIVDVLRLARQPGASQAQIDRLAMAAVSLQTEALQ